MGHGILPIGRLCNSKITDHEYYHNTRKSLLIPRIIYTYCIQQHKITEIVGYELTTQDNCKSFEFTVMLASNFMP